MAQLVKNPPAMRETWLRSLAWEDPTHKGKSTHFSVLAWRIPWTVCIDHGVAESDTTERLSLLPPFFTQHMTKSLFCSSTFPYPFTAESKEKLKSLLMKVKESEKSGLKLNIQKTEIWSHHFMTNNRWGNNGNSERLYFGGLQSHCRG